VEPLKGFHFNGRPIALPVNTRLGCKSMEVVNTLGYFYDTATISAVKSFIVQAPEASILKVHTTVSYTSA
jgi:hypothetical protein